MLETIVKSLPIWCVVAMLFCTSWSLGWTEAVPMLHFDHEGVLWLVGMNDYLQESRTLISGWPIGQSNVQLDSILLLWLAQLCQAAHYPYLFMYLITIVGLSLSAWSAQRLSAALYPTAKRWAWVAGVTYGFQALYTVSILEGHVYLLWTFWLPMGWWCLERLSKIDSTKNIIWVVGCWFGALLTSAYIGLCATLLYVGYALWHWKNHHRGRTIVLSICTVLGVGYSWRLFNHPLGDQRVLATYYTTEIQAGCATLSNLITWSPDADIFQHSLAPTLGWIPFLVLCTAPWYYRRKVAFPMITAGLALLLSMGPFIAMSPEEPLFPSPFLILYGQIVGQLFHFPVRFIYLSVLGVAVVIPMLLQQWSVLAPKRVWILAVMCIIEPFFIYGLPVRQGWLPIQRPSIYHEAPDGFAILDIVPRLDDENLHLLEALRLKNKICAYQVDHKHTLINECLGKGHAGMLEEKLRDDLVSPMFQRPWEEILMEFGVGAVVLHGDLWPPEKRTAIIKHISNTLGTPIVRTDGGENLIMWTLPITADKVDIPAARQRFNIP